MADSGSLDIVVDGELSLPAHAVSAIAVIPIVYSYLVLPLPGLSTLSWSHSGELSTVPR